MNSITVTEIKGFSLSPDRTQATFTLVTKYAGDIVVTMPISCLDALRSPQENAKERAQDRTPAPAPRAPSSVQAGGSPAPAGVKAKAPAQAAADPTAVSVELRMPKKFMLAADVKNHGIVALIFDPRTDREAGFALTPKAAQELATGLVKNADAILAHKPPAKNN